MSTSPRPASVRSGRSLQSPRSQAETLPLPVTAHEEPLTISHHFPMLHRKHLFLKNELFAAIAEFVGTFMFAFMAFSAANVANVPSPDVGTTGGIASAGTVNPSQLLYISLAFGFSLAVNAWWAFRLSGGLFNPAVSFGLALVGVISPLRAAVLTISQLVAFIAASAAVYAIFPSDLNVRTSLSAGMSPVQGLFLEMFLTSLLLLTILFLAAEKHKATYLAPVGIGLALFVAELAGVYYTGGSLNPARTLGPDIVLGEFNDYEWIYVLGPLLGAAISAGFYRLSKYIEYDSVNPDQDSDGAAGAHLLAIAVPENGDAPRIMDAHEVEALVAGQEAGAAAAAEKGLRAIISENSGH